MKEGMVMHCPKCESEEKRKSGIVKGAQRFECKRCGCHYTRSSKHGYSDAVKMQAVRLYREGMGFRRIGRILGVSNVIVLKWVRAFGQMIKDKVAQSDMSASDVEIIEMDELWHYTQKKTASYGYGLLCLVPRDGSSPMKWALVDTNGHTDSGQKPTPDART
jgi:transposase-like protein